MDLSLDDIIQQNRKDRGRGRGRGTGALRGVRRGGIMRRNSGGNRTLPDKWQHDMFPGGRGPSSAVSSNKLHISNLDFGVSNADINELFREFGVIRRATVHYDRSGRSLGTAEVTFTSPLSAIKARNNYNGVPLDGRPMVIQLVGADATQSDGLRDRVGPPRNAAPGRRFPNARRGALSPRRGRGRGRGRDRRTPVTKEELDAELAAYNAQRA